MSDTVRILEYQLVVLAHQWLTLHPEMETLTFSLNPQDPQSVETVPKPKQKKTTTRNKKSGG